MVKEIKLSHFDNKYIFGDWVVSNILHNQELDNKLFHLHFQSTNLSHQRLS